MSALVSYQDFAAGSGTGGHGNGIAFYHWLSEDPAKAVAGLGVFDINGLIQTDFQTGAAR